mmetsp:Transcript_77341/g.170851  ORF Transcript_77341/g.170851 Transcript_77341/m.170851 type:complete len:262 (-) Transcript_77341:1017-1802(-)
MDESVLNAELSHAIWRPVVTPFGEAGSIWGGRHQLWQRCAGYSWQGHLIKTHAHSGFKMIAAGSQGSGTRGGWRLPWNLHPRSFPFHIFHGQRRRWHKVGAITQRGAIAALVLVEPWMRSSGMSSGMSWLRQVRSVIVELVAVLLRASCISHGLRYHYCALCSLGKIWCQVGGRNHAHIALGSRCHRHLHQRLLMSGLIACHHLSTFSMTMLTMLTMLILRLNIGSWTTEWTNWTSWTHHIAMALQTYMANVLQFWILQEF